MSGLLAFPLCRRCGIGDLVLVSDHNGEGGEQLYKDWVCTNEACAFIIRMRRGEIFFAHAQVLPAEPTPESEPPAKGSTWQVWLRGR
jgi:hypothetical protein